MILARFDFILEYPASPNILYLGPYPATVGVYLRLASLVMTSTAPLLTAAILVKWEPISTPTTEGVRFYDY